MFMYGASHLRPSVSPLLSRTFQADSSHFRPVKHRQRAVAEKFLLGSLQCLTIESSNGRTYRQSLAPTVPFIKRNNA